MCLGPFGVCDPSAVFDPSASARFTPVQTNRRLEVRVEITCGLTVRMGLVSGQGDSGISLIA